MIRTDAANSTVRNSDIQYSRRNGYQGGDSGHGGRTYICFEDLCSTDMDAVVSYGQDTNAKVEIMLGDDSERDSMIYALIWAADKLEELKNCH